MANYYAAIAIELDSASLFRAILARADHNGAQPSIYQSGCLLGRCQSLTLAKTGCLLPNYVVSAPWKPRLRLTSAWATVQELQLPVASRDMRNTRRKGAGRGREGAEGHVDIDPNELCFNPKTFDKQTKICCICS